MQLDQENLLDLLDDIEAEIEDSEFLFDFKDFFKDSLLEGAKLVKEINNSSKDTPDYYVYIDAIEQISNNLVRVYNIDKDIFEKLLTYSGFTNEQVNDLSSGIEFSEDRLKEMSILLIDSFYKKIDILQNINSKRIMARKNYQNNNDNLFSDFIEYILEDVLPAQAMENLAKISAFQRTRLNTVLNKDPIFKSIFEKYKDGEDLNLSEKTHIKNTLNSEIREMLTKVPVYKKQNNIEFCFLQTEHDIRIWDKTSGRNRPDAFGIDENNILYAYTVTSNINLENQNNQVIEFACRISNGIKLKKIDIEDFKVIACCSPVLNDLDEKGILFKAFRKEVNNLNKINIINQNEINSLKRLAIDLELLSIFRNISIDKYNELKDNLEFNVLGENFCIIPKPAKEQYIESMNNLNLSLNCINKIIDNNPNLEKISTPIKLIMEGLSKGIYNGINSPLNDNEEISDIISNSINSLKIKLVNTMHTSFKNINFGKESPELITHFAELLNLKYKEEKDIIENWNYKKNKENLNHGMSEHELYSFKNDGHNCKFDFSNSSTSLISQITKLTYNNRNINESLMNDTLSFISYKLTKNNFHKGTLKTLINGINNALNSEFPYDLKKACKSFIKNEIIQKVINELEGDNKIIISNEIKKILERKINRLNSKI